MGIGAPQFQSRVYPQARDSGFGLCAVQCPEAVRHEREISNAGRWKPDFAERYQCKPVLLRLSLAGNLDKPLLEGSWLWTLCAVYIYNYNKRSLLRYYRTIAPGGSKSICVGNLIPAMGARNQVGIGLSYRLVSLCSLATQFQTRFLEPIPRPMAGLKFSTLKIMCLFRKRMNWKWSNLVLSYIVPKFSTI